MFYLKQEVLEQEKRAIWQGKFSLFPEGIAHAVSTRMGGVAEPPFDTMDMAYHTGDDTESVWRNRRMFCASLGLSAKRICSPKQVHGARVIRVSEGDAGKGSQRYDDALPGTDALITDVPGIPLWLCFADCTPLLFADPVHHAIGAAHAGWKGTVQSIGQKTIEAMQKSFGTRPEDCLVGIGPAIGPCCYEIGPEVEEQFRAAFPAWQERILKKEGKRTLLNLWAANVLPLVEIGVMPEHIDAANVCTCCNAKLFFSYRADCGKTGRIAAVIALRE